MVKDVIPGITFTKTLIYQTGKSRLANATHGAAANAAATASAAAPTHKHYKNAVSVLVHCLIRQPNKNQSLLQPHNF